MISRKFKILIISVIVIVIVAGASTYILSQQAQPLKIIKTEKWGGAYNAQFDIMGTDQNGYEFGNIVYTKDGVEHTGYYDSYLNNSMSWIKNNTPENTIFLNWWDYGQMIVGSAERDSVNKNPSQEALTAVDPAYRSIFKEFDSNEKIVDVATSLTTTNESITKSVMEKYGASYVLITSDDNYKAYWMYYFAGLNATQYWSPSSSGTLSADFTELGKQTMIYKFETNSGLSLFTEVYSDVNVKIFKISS